MELYIHIPFCRKKCRYCSFASFVGKEAYFETYVDHLLKEASFRISEAEEPVTTVYIGGGTPSLLPPALLEKLILGLKKIYGFDSLSEFTSEANPGTVTKDWISAASGLGINRLSFGMQASQEHLLSLLGRIHRPEDVASSFRLARDAGITNISLDLIFGIPGQTESDWSDTLNTALSLSPCHISAYGLIPEEGTPLYQDLQLNRIHLPDPDLERKMYDSAVHLLKSHGFSRYEISNFAQPGFECVHNIGYWTQIPYIGLGVSAASMSDLKRSVHGMCYRRRANPETLDEYFAMVDKNHAVTADELISSDASRFETIMLGFRMTRGISEDDFFKKHGVFMETLYGDKMRKLEKSGLLFHEGNYWKMTDRGLDIQNSILVELMD